MDKNNYFETRALTTIDKINAILETLPYFVQDFFVGIENRTSPLTRLNYAYDLRIFFNYLSKRRYKGKEPSEITLKDIEQLEVSEIEMYLSYLSRYTINGKQESCTEHGKARKLASLRSFYKYFFSFACSFSFARWTRFLQAETLIPRESAISSWDLPSMASSFSS